MTAPLDIDEARAPAAPRAAGSGAGPGGVRPVLAGRRVLVVEDDPLTALDLCLVLQDLGCVPVGPAASVEAAMPMATLHPLDAAMLDEDLGATLVTPVAHALARRGIPFVIVSGHLRPLSTNTLITEAPRLPKPARIAQIGRALAASLARA